MIFTHEADHVPSASTGDAQPSPLSRGGKACSDHRVLLGTPTLVRSPSS
ncbi:hypothetical protein [Nonomuraea sediminis]|nr:hypothetical protein [Nonomuraea sediminis]